MNLHKLSFIIKFQLLLFAFFSFTSNIYSQNNEKIESLLKKVEETKSDTLQAKIYIELSEQFEESDEQRAKYYLSKAESIYQKYPAIDGLSEVYYSLGFINEFFNKKDSSIIFFNLAIALAKKHGHEKNLAKYYIGKGWYYMRQKDNISAITEYQNSIEICKKFNLKRDWADALRKIANLVLKTEDYQKAFNLYREALSLYTQENDTVHVAQTIGGLGYAFKEASMYDSAAYYLNIATSKFLALQNYSMVIIANAELANLSILAGKPNLAFDYINKANEFRKKTSYSLSDDLINIYHANALKATGNYSEAIKKYLIGIEIAKQQGDVDNVHNGYLWLFETYEKNNDYKNAFKYQTIFENIEDSIANLEKLNALKEVTTKYDFEKQQRELDKKKFEVKKKDAIIYSTIGFLFLLSVVAYLYYKRKNAEQKTLLQQKLLEQEKKATLNILEAEEKERKRITAELHDGIGQTMTAAWMNMQTVLNSNMDETQKNDVFQKALSLLDESCKEIRVVSHNMMPNVLLKKGLVNAVKDFLAQINKKDLNINIESDGLQKAIPPHIETVLYRVIQEAVNNVIKHAKASDLFITLYNEDDGIDVMIEDNGVGFDKHNISSDGIGLQNIKSRIAYLKGTVEWDTSENNGTVLSIHIPIV